MYHNSSRFTKFIFKFEQLLYCHDKKSEARTGPYKMNYDQIINQTTMHMYKIRQFFKINIPLLTLRPRLLFTRKGSMTLKYLETKGCP